MKKIIVLTGATSGLGELLLKKLSQEDHTIFIPVRNIKKAKIMIEACHPHKAEIIPVKADLSEQDEISEAIKEILEKTDVIDVLINNAGVFKMKRERNSQGIEIQFMVNYLAARQFSYGLLPALQKAENGRIINVASKMHTGGNFIYSDLQMEKKYSAQNAYSITKLYLVTHTFYLAEKLKNSTVTANVMHPGVYATGITGELPAPLNFLWHLFLPSANEGADILYNMSFNENLKSVTGQYFDKAYPTEAKKSSYVKENQQILEDYAEKMTGISLI